MSSMPVGWCAESTFFGVVGEGLDVHDAGRVVEEDIDGVVAVVGIEGKDDIGAGFETVDMAVGEGGVGRGGGGDDVERGEGGFRNGWEGRY